MTRREKYPETRTFRFYNANPKGRITTDCVIRAISTALDLPYNTVVMEMAKLQCETGYDDGDVKLYDRYLAKNGWQKAKQPRKADNTKYTGKEFCKVLNGTFYCEEVRANIGGGHMVCFKKVDGKFKVWDTWDSTDGCVGNYWIRM